MNSTLERAVDHAAGLIADADALLIAAGAGMGVDSGLPDFRGTHGFWRAYPALGEAGLAFEQIADPRAFIERPRTAWGFYGHRLALYRVTLPHAGFDVLRRWAEAKPFGGRVFTSNVDGQFQRAGFDERGVHECHGSLHHLQCSQPHCGSIWNAQALEPTVDEARCEWLGPLPECPSCGQLARPNVLMFNDAHWRDERSGAQWQRLSSWLARVERLVVVEIGAGTRVPSVRHFSHRMVTQFEARLVRINPDHCAVPTSRDVAIAAGASAALQALDAAMAAGASASHSAPHPPSHSPPHTPSA